MTLVRRLSGKGFGKYTLGEYLGYTGVAHVYKAVHPKTNKEIAIHLLPNHLVDQPGFEEGFNRKASRLFDLRYMNIIPTLDSGVHQGYPYLVTAHIEGPTLQDLVETSEKRKVKIPLEASLFVINSLCGALSHAHKAGIPHGNLSMSNILLEESGIVMVSDFGLYRIMIYKPQFGSGKTESQETQQKLNEEMQLDIASLGIIFYHLVTGKTPYESSSTLLFSRGQNKPDLVKPSVYVPDIPEKLEEVIVKCLDYDPNNQYHSINELVKDLANLKRKVRTAMLPSAQLMELAQSSNRFSKSEVPEAVAAKDIENPTLYFPDNGQMLELKEGKEYSIGRQYKGQPILPDIDLTPFKGYDWGISRLHASLRVVSEKVYVTDLGSSNGTWINGERISPNKPYELNNADIFLLGRLRVQILMPD